MMTFIEDEEIDLRLDRLRGIYLTDCNERMTKCRKEDLTCHNEDIFCIKKPLPLVVSFWMTINLGTHSLRVRDCVSFNDISLLKNKMDQGYHKNTKFLLLIN